MNKQFGIAVFMAATIAGGGLALAAEGSNDQSAENDTEDVVETTTSTSESVEVEAEEESTDAPAAGENHGADVSTAAHDCPTGADAVHGICVSAVARDHDGDGTPDHGPGSPGFQSDGDDEGDEGTEETEDSDDPVEPATAAHGQGHAHGDGS